jgi:uncharacterized protein (DUF433 family)
MQTAYSNCITGRPGVTNVPSAAEFIRTLDSREMPRYSIGEAAVYLGLPESTVRAWFVGTTYGSQPHVHRFHPVLTPASRDLLSFFDIASAHILMAFKRQRVSPGDLRAIVAALRREFPDDRYPLLGRNFYMFGKAVILKQLGQRLNLSKGRQLGMRKIMDRFLSRVDVDVENMPVRFSPLRDKKATGRGFIVIDPQLSSGRPVVRGTGIAAEIVAKRRQSGESIASLAKDYRMSRRAIEEAVNYFAQKTAA